MIHVRAQGSSPSEVAPEFIAEPVLHISFVGFKTIDEFKKVLDGFLNCKADFNPDYFQLSDKIETFLKKEESFQR